jgi:hypothetical protein
MDKSTLTEAETASLGSTADFIHDGVEGIVKSGPKSSLFVPDSLQVSAIDDLLNNAPTLASNIQKDLKYSSKPDVEQVLVKDLHKQLDNLNGIFTELDKATAAEIEMIAEGLSTASLPSPPKPDDKQKIKEAAAKNSEAAFKDLAAIDVQIRMLNQGFTEAMQKNQQKQQQF